MKVDKRTWLTLISAACGIGSVITGMLQKDSEIDEAAKKAAEIVMKKGDK